MAGPEYQRFELGDWLVEPEVDRISRDGVCVSIQPKAMQLLVYLANRGGHVVSTDDILDDLWADVTVASGSVYFCISQLREALGDDSHHPTYIETISKHGYRLIPAARFEGENDNSPEPGSASLEAESKISLLPYLVRSRWAIVAVVVVIAALLAFYRLT